MKQQITKCQFHDKFKDMGRGEQFSYYGLNALYDYLEDLEEQCDTIGTATGVIQSQIDVLAGNKSRRKDVRNVAALHSAATRNRRNHDD